MIRPVLAQALTLALAIVSACGTPASGPTVTPLPPTPTPTPLPPTPTPTPRVKEPNYTNAAMGLCIWYPQDWAYEEEEEQVIFGTSEEIIEYGPEEGQTGAVMVIVGGELEGLETGEEMVEMMVSELRSEEEMKISDQKSHTIGGQHGTMVTFAGTPEDFETPVRGFVAGADYKGQGYLFVGLVVAAPDDRSGAKLLLVTERILDSVQFTKRHQ